MSAREDPETTEKEKSPPPFANSDERWGACKFHFESKCESKATANRRRINHRSRIIVALTQSILADTDSKGRAAPPMKSSVFEQIGFSREEAASLKMKSELHSRIVKAIKKQGYTQADLQKRLDESQPRISDLMTEKIAKFSLETLIIYAEALDLHAQILVEAR
jgi:predicted XRE-type DNA-binding protein